jgi:hypothetical protein
VKESTMKELPKELNRKMTALKPAKLRALLADESTQELKQHGDHRKGWMHALDALRKLDWVRVDLLDTKGALLGSVDNEERAAAVVDEVAPARADRCCPTCGHSAMDARAIAKLIIESQERALRWQDTSVKTALDANTATMHSMTRSIEVLSNVHQASLATVIEAAEAQLAAGGGGDLVEDGDGDPSDAMFAQLTSNPKFLRRLLFGGGRKPAKPATPATPANGKSNGAAGNGAH